jgi:PBP1b-binding outer membrane lipoprotein LpoB
MKNRTKLLWLAGASLGLALSLNGCDKKSEEPPASVGSAPAPATETPATPSQPSSPSGDTGSTGSAPQKSDTTKSEG